MTTPKADTRRVPFAVKCAWTARKGERHVYDCLNCGQWTANLPLYKDDVCPARDRRKGQADRRTT